MRGRYASFYWHVRRIAASKNDTLEPTWLSTEGKDKRPEYGVRDPTAVPDEAQQTQTEIAKRVLRSILRIVSYGEDGDTRVILAATCLSCVLLSMSSERL